MHFRNIQIIFAFITYALFVLSSPINNNGKVNTNALTNDVEVSSDDETAVVSASIENEDDYSSDTEVEVGIETETVTITIIPEQQEQSEQPVQPVQPEKPEHYIETIVASNEITKIEEGMYITQFTGDYGLDQLIATCSSFSVSNEKGDGFYFGRSYDWVGSDTLIVVTHPVNGYSSISTVSKLPIDRLLNGVEVPDFAYQAIAIYTPHDYMEKKSKGLCRCSSILVRGGEQYNPM
ncbi:hypothetical protein PIROE2DRAFT_1129 [Piromyces sp. E2]|nr:hypothetical protein PIROE2DRAFT_1129 [Piromyces sp. E2]|eukprot:OUM70605.1 hypothetical protein PIROE2DRAFT_1129 [Piromyces sp. E2]